MSLYSGFLDIKQRRAVLAGGKEDEYDGANVNTLNGVFAMSRIQDNVYTNCAYRRTVFTTGCMQIAVMCISPEDKEISMETFPDTALTVFVIRGAGELISNAASVGPSPEYLHGGDLAVVPAGVPHRLLNCSVSANLFAYVIYSKPVFATDLLQISCDTAARPFSAQTLVNDE